MNKYKKIVSIAATAVMCVAPMSVYAQEAQTDVIEAVAEKKQDTESSSVPVLQKEGIEISEGTGYDLSKEPGAATVKALEQGTIVISYKTTSENAIQSLLSVGNGTKGNQERLYMQRISFMQEMLQNPTISESHPFWRWILVQ